MKSISFSTKEYERRVRALRVEMKDHGIEVMVCHNLSSICYLTGFQTLGSYGYGHYAAIIPQDSGPVLFTSDFESHNARMFSPVKDIVVYGCIPDYEGGPVDELCSLIKERGWHRSRIGYESLHFSMTVLDYLKMKKALPEAVLLDGTVLMDKIKIIKSEEEIAVLKKSAEITSEAVKAAYGALRDPVRDNDIAAAAYACAVQRGAEYFSLQPIVTTGSRSGIPHSTFRRTPIERGDPVFIEVASSYERYSAPAMRTILYGDVSSEIRKSLDACVNSVNYVTENLKAGINGKDVALKAGEGIRSIVPDLVWHGYYCYSVGLGFPPACSDLVSSGFSVTEKYEFIVEKGMVFHCSTSLRDIGRYGVTCSETILVKEDGCETLTDIPKYMIIK